MIQTNVLKATEQKVKKNMVDQTLNYIYYYNIMVNISLICDSKKHEMIEMVYGPPE